MTLYLKDWNAISARIEGLRRAHEIFRLIPHNENTGSQKNIRDGCSSTLQEVKKFREKYSDLLPDEILLRLDSFINKDAAPTIEFIDGNAGLAPGAIILLVLLDIDVQFHLRDTQADIISRTERAFVLLQRMLTVDTSVQEKWIKAFRATRSGEITCEKLGAVHLLWQGIYAFKADGIKGRTDLVFPDEIEPRDIGPITRSVAGMVLTEWKVGKATEASQKYAEARRQAEIYRDGALAGVELAKVRYLIVVSEASIAQVPKDDPTREGHIYRHINIVLRPDHPSVQARKRPAEGSA